MLLSSHRGRGRHGNAAQSRLQRRVAIRRGYYQRTIDGRWRVSTARAYLKPAMRRGNLVVRTNARALAVEFEGSRATGVRYVRGDSLASPVVVRDE